ncbi:MAG: sigma-70 family RNA polymerase sigma factor [Bacteroidetes bacterium]|nr:sigma-70 family RNA polymerase sigma factor [Bacteroidota bacterium]
MHPDQRYITALLTNDRQLIEDIYKKYSGKIRWMILQNNGDETDAADIFQESLAAIYQKAVKQDFILTCPFESFLYLVCKNKWINELNKRKTRNVTFTEDAGYSIGEDSIQQAALVLQQEERKNLLEQKLEELGEGCRKLLQLSWSGKAMDEVASLLNVTYGYVRKKKSECMAKLINLVKNAPQFNALKW